MRNIASYIIEKLKINKDTENTDDSVFSSGKEIYDILDLETFENKYNSIDRWMQDNKISEFKAFYRILNKSIIKKIKYDFSRFIEANKKITDFVLLHNKLSDYICYYKSKDCSILSDSISNKLIIIDKRYRDNDSLNDIYILLEPCKE